MQSSGVSSGRRIGYMRKKGVFMSLEKGMVLVGWRIRLCTLGIGSSAIV